MPNSGQAGLPDFRSTQPDGTGWWAPSLNDGGGRPVLYSWGLIMFEIFPLNIHEVDHETATDWAHKEIAGAPIYREWVGENDELLHFRGRIFPYRIGGMSDLELFESMRQKGVVNAMLRGNPAMMIGWFACERLVRSHTFLSTQGVGQQVTFEAVMARFPVPDSSSYFSQIWQTTGAAA
jgi:hypothetical protein